MGCHSGSTGASATRAWFGEGGALSSYMVRGGVDRVRRGLKERGGCRPG